MTRKVTKSIKVNMLLSLVREAMQFLFPILTTMYVVRTIGKEHYGHVQFVRSVISYFALLAGLGISTYAMREGARVRDHQKSFQKLNDEITTIHVISASLSVLLLICFLIIFHTREDNFDWLLYVIFCLPIIASVLGRDWINTVYEDYLYITLRYIITSFLTLLLLFALVRTEEDYRIYACLISFSVCSYQLFNIFYVKRYARFQLSSPVNSVKHVKPILVLFCSSIASVIYLNSDITMLGILIDNEAVAVYTIASSIYAAVKQVSNSMVAVLSPRLSYYAGMDKEEQSRSLINRICDYIIVLIIPSVVGLFEMSRECLIFLGGENYIVGVSSLRVLSLALVFAVFANILVRCILIPRQQDKVFLDATVLSAVLNIVLNLVLIPRLSYVGAAITTLLAEMTIFIVLLFHSLKLIRVSISLRSITKVFISCIPIVFICELVRSITSNIVIVLFMATTISIILYFLALLMLRHSAAIEISRIGIRLIKREKKTFIEKEIYHVTDTRSI